MKCPYCGAENPENSTFCSNCGNALIEDGNSIGFNVLAVLFPFVGWILWAVWRKEKPIKAHGVAVWAWIGFAIALVINFVLF